MSIFDEMRFGGIRIVESASVPARPVMAVPAASLLSAATRARLDARLLELHGVRFDAVVIAATMYVHPSGAAELAATLQRMEDERVMKMAAFAQAIAAKLEGGSDGAATE